MVKLVQERIVKTKELPRALKTAAIRIRNAFEKREEAGINELEAQIAAHPELNDPDTAKKLVAYLKGMEPGRQKGVVKFSKHLDDVKRWSKAVREFHNTESDFLDIGAMDDTDNDMGGGG
ncbi:MAG: hypothetical protein NTX79_02830 [Candidatus Micrarchaeota archaeon]|nr:hypothetical protein [Candidatus Micrarchaeota archaeon]